MRRLLAFGSALVLGAVVPAVVAAPAANAACSPPDGLTRLYSFSSSSQGWYGTNVYSDWASFPKGGSITYNETKTMEVSASVTATVSAEAGVIFAKASASLGVTVGGSYSYQKSWTYSANVPANTANKYRLHLYHRGVNFTVTEKMWSPATCTFKTMSGYPSVVGHAPILSTSSNYSLWQLDKTAK